MTTAYDVPANELILKVAEKLKDNDNIKPPEWAAYVKTGAHKELPPVQEDWWYTRCASILRTVYYRGPVGVERLTSVYGGKKNRGSKAHRKAQGSGSIIRAALQQLESAGYLKKVEKEGRVVSSAGQSFLDNTAYEVKLELVETRPEFNRY
ncbi:MAG: 30S ribosomal protein S19e [Methanosarcinaceae archaeon]|nr:30S ribosomal protein S19e [Methanosarcinaceae archaeon]